MNKILIGSFLTVALIISGTVNVKAQSKTDSKNLKREVVKRDMPSKKAVKIKKVNTSTKKVTLKKDTPKTKKLNTTVKKVAIKKDAPNTKNKVVVKKVAKDNMKKQPAKLNKNKK